MFSKGTYFGVVVGAVMLVGVVLSVPLEDAWEEDFKAGGHHGHHGHHPNPREGEETTTTAPEEEETTTVEPETTTMSPGWGSGWIPPTGDTAAFGQTLILGNLAGSDTQSNPIVLEATAGWNSPANMTLNVTQVADMEFNINDGDYTPGGGAAEVEGAYAEVDAAYGYMNQEALYNSSIVVTGLSSGGIISNPQTSASLSAGAIVVSSSGQVTDGTNVNPGWGNSGWGNSGWRNQGSGWTEEEATTQTPEESSGWGSGWGWPATSDGQTASASSLEAIDHLSQQASSSDNITALVIGDDHKPVNITGTIQAPVILEGEFNGNGVEAYAGDNAEAGTNWQGVSYSSYPENNATLSVENANATALTSKPNTTSTLSIGSVIISDFATANSGVNLVNQNSGGWGWGQQAQGWGQPAQSGWKAPKP